MQKINASDPEIGNADEEKIMILEQSPGIPDHHEDAAGNDDAETLCKAMEEKIAVEAGHGYS